MSIYTLPTETTRTPNDDDLYGLYDDATKTFGKATHSALKTYLGADATAGTVTASKAVIVDANKDIGDFRNLDAVNIDAGASGTAGTVDVFPSTAAKGKLSITAADNTGDTTTTIVNALQATTRTYTIPDAGANAAFVMSSANYAATATADGLTTGLIPAGTQHVTVTSASASNIVTLPAAVIGTVIHGYVGANGCEMRTPASSNATINDVDSDGTNQAAIPATTLFRAHCVSATGWILLAWDELGAPITAIVPDAPA